MSVVLITGSSGLVGSESVNFFCDKGFDVIGIDNNLRKFFFGPEGSTLWVKNLLLKKNKNFKSLNIDIRNYNKLEKLFKKYKKKNFINNSLCSPAFTRLWKKFSNNRF